MKCDVIARGVIAAAKNVDLTIPLVVRLEGTNVERGRELLNSSGLDLISADSLDHGAKLICEAVK
jgi:succinyl-CoA synthetase beta subunit